jgi:hypothetical protein
MKYYNKRCSAKRAIQYLNNCRLIHWRYTKHPSWCRGWLGSQEHHKEWVDRYTEIINLLKYDTKNNRSKI